MISNGLFIAFLPLILAGCDAANSKTCMSNPQAFVKVERNNPSALDGYTYRLCTASAGSRDCDKYDELVLERPTYLSIALSGGVLRVEQFGGSVDKYATDPAGMRNPAYQQSVPIEFSYHVNSLQGRQGVAMTIDGAAVPGSSCPS
jgi:hypothetical protein